MATSNTTTATRNNVVVNPSTSATEQAQSRRLWESRDMWRVVFDHTVALITLTLKGEKLPENPRDGFAFGKGAVTKDGKALKLSVSKDQPHIVGYAAQLLAGFGSYATKKATKALAEVGVQNEVLSSNVERMAIASQLAEACKLATQGDGASRLRREIDAHHAKQGNALILAVAAALSEAKPTETEAEATPKGVEEKPKKAVKKSATPFGGKAKTAKPKRKGSNSFGVTPTEVAAELGLV